MSVTPLVLASSSPRRRDLLRQAGYTVQIVPAAIIEAEDPWLTVPELVLLNAGRKALAVRGDHPAAVVLGVDTLVALDGMALGKPADRAAAAAMLARLSGREHQVYSGVCVTRLRPERTTSFVAVTQVRFRALSEEDIAGYLALIDPLDKAGGYAAQEQAERIIAAVDGSWSNVIGLPLERLEEVLPREFGICPERLL